MRLNELPLNELGPLSPELIGLPIVFFEQNGRTFWRGMGEVIGHMSFISAIGWLMCSKKDDVLEKPVSVCIWGGNASDVAEMKNDWANPKLFAEPSHILISGVKTQSPVANCVSRELAEGRVSRYPC